MFNPRIWCLAATYVWYGGWIVAADCGAPTLLAASAATVGLFVCALILDTLDDGQTEKTID